MIRIPGVKGWFRESDIAPCACGEALFWVGKGKHCCVKCLPPGKGEKPLGFVDMVRREVKGVIRELPAS